MDALLTIVTSGTLRQLKEKNEGSMCELRRLAKRKEIQQKECKKDRSGDIGRKKFYSKPIQMAQQALSHRGKGVISEIQH